jgi:hypothetical protein
MSERSEPFAQIISRNNQFYETILTIAILTVGGQNIVIRYIIRGFCTFTDIFMTLTCSESRNVNRVTKGSPIFCSGVRGDRKIDSSLCLEPLPLSPWLPLQ